MGHPIVTIIGDEAEGLITLGHCLNCANLTTYVLPLRFATPMAVGIARTDLIIIDTWQAEQAFGLLDALQRDPETVHIPTILSLGEVPARCTDLTQIRVEAVLVRPVEPDELVQRIRDVLGQPGRT